jgi:hypothetical protein
MLIAIAQVIYDDWIDDMRSLGSRVTLAKEVLKKCFENPGGIQLLVLPAGFVMCTKREDCDIAAESLRRASLGAEITLAFGVDYRRTKESGAKKTPISPPFFGYVVGPKGEKLIWGLRQRGTGGTCRVDKKSLDSELTADEAIRSKRLFPVADKTVALIICGEMTTSVTGTVNRARVPEYIVKTRKDVDLIVDIAHGDKLIKPHPRSWFPAMGSIGRPSIVCEHISNRYLDHKGMVKDKTIGPVYERGLGKPVKITRDDRYYLQVYELK